jgi:hypothetical protein
MTGSSQDIGFELFLLLVCKMEVAIDRVVNMVRLVAKGWTVFVRLVITVHGRHHRLQNLLLIERSFVLQ